MNCEYCHCKLNPYLLKQAGYLNNELIFEIECLSCRKYNYLSEESYLYLKTDHKMPCIQPLNNKLPKDMNVIIISMERCGISWIIRALSQYHKKMFNSDIPFFKENAEISKQLATKNRFDLPKQWNNVYEVNPQVLLDRIDPEGLKYDRVLVVQRDLKTQEWVDRIYLSQEGLAQEHIENIIRKIKEVYKIVYRDDITDPRYLKVNLEDINNYATDTMNELMDFFNFPEVGRPPVVPFKPQWFERNWEALSSILEKGFELTGRLGRIRDKFQVSKDGLLEFLATTPISTKQSKVEYKELKDILILGSMPFRGCHFGENIYKSFMGLEYETSLIYAQLLQNDMTNNQYNRYLQRKDLYPISKLVDRLEKRPELIIVDQIGFGWKNDTTIPVFYKHNFFKRPPIVKYPTVALFPHEAVITYFQTMFANRWCDKIKELRVMPIAIDPDHFEIIEKKSIKGISCIGGRENMKQLGRSRELMAIALVETSRRQVQEFIQLGLNWIDDGDGDGGGVSDARYRELLPHLEGLWVLIPFGQYISRRILEAMYCKVVCVIKIEDDYHEKSLERIGFIANEHYIKIDKLEEMVELNKNWVYEDYNDMVEKSHKLVLEKHTYDKRAKEIIELYEELRIKNET